MRYLADTLRFVS